MESHPDRGDEDQETVDEAPEIFAEPSPPAPRFCRYCGRPLNSHTGLCDHCKSIETSDGASNCEAVSPDTEPVAAEAAYPVTMALGLYFVLLAVLLVGAAMFPHDPSRLELFIVGVHAFIVLAVVVVAWPLLGSGVRWCRPSWLVIALAAGGATFAGATIIIQTLVSTFGIEEILITDALRADGYSYAAVIAVSCVQPAVIEELAFRGVILGGLQRILRPGEALVVSSLLFATIHLAFLSLPIHFGLGLLLGYLRMRSGSLLPAIVMHFSHNFLCVIFEYSRPV